MANVLDLRRRIRSVKNTRQITKAMKMVAAAELRRAQERALASRPYAAMLAGVIRSMMRRADTVDPETGEVRHPLMLAREEKTILLVVVAGDKGFAGAFNANIAKTAFRFLDEHGKASVDIETIGRKARDLFRRRYPEAGFVEAEPGDGTAADGTAARKRGERRGRIELAGGSSGLLDKLSFARVAELARMVTDRYAREEIDAVYVVYNEFKSVIAQRVVVERLLPIVEVGGRHVAAAGEMSAEERARAGEAALSSGVSLRELDTEEAEEEAKKFGTAEVDYLYEQPPAELLDSMLPRYVTTALYHALIESVAAERAARMTAMDAATNNATEMIDQLTLTMNRVRQAAITKEIIEIVSGAAAL